MTETFLDFGARMRSTPWALSAPGIARLRGFVDAGPRGARASRPPPRRRGAAAGTSVISIVGFIDQHAGLFETFGIGISCDTINAALNDALADPAVGRIVLDIDSPGGSVYGVGELAASIRAARSQKPIIAIANSLAASAAYWLGCSASRFYMSPGAEVGSIGVWMAHEDWSKAVADSGVAVTLISAGKYKVEGNPYSPLDADARAFLQSRTDAYYSDFTKAVAAGRGVPIDAVRSGMGQGRVLGAAQALQAGMVDAVATFGEVLGGHGAARAGMSAAAARDELTLLALGARRSAPRPNVAAALRELDRLD